MGLNLHLFHPKMAQSPFCSQRLHGCPPGWIQELDMQVMLDVYLMFWCLWILMSSWMNRGVKYILYFDASEFQRDCTVDALKLVPDICLNKNMWMSFCQMTFTIGEFKYLWFGLKSFESVIAYNLYSHCSASGTILELLQISLLEFFSSLIDAVTIIILTIL